MTPLSATPLSLPTFFVHEHSTSIRGKLKVEEENLDSIAKSLAGVEKNSKASLADETDEAAKALLGDAANDFKVEEEVQELEIEVLDSNLPVWLLFSEIKKYGTCWRYTDMGALVGVDWVQMKAKMDVKGIEPDPHVIDAFEFLANQYVFYKSLQRPKQKNKTNTGTAKRRK